MPDVGLTVVVSMPTVVDLPAPFGPSSPKTSPVATSKSIPFTASTPPAQVLLEAAHADCGWVRVVVIHAGSDDAGRGNVTRRPDVTFWPAASSR